LLAVALEAEQKLDEYRLNDLARILYEFTWHEYCDWYLEMAKVRISQGGVEAVEARRGILFGLRTALKLLHPLIPFITEEIWHHLPGTEGDLINAPWPEVAPRSIEARGEATPAGSTVPAPAGEPGATARWVDPEAEEAMALLRETVVTVRNIRSEMNVPPSREAAVSIRADARSSALYRECASYLKTLARISELHIGPDVAKPRFAASDVAGNSEVFVHLEGIIDLDLERQRLDRELEKNEKLLASARRKLENPDFLDRAKPEVVEKEREKLLLIEETMAKLSRARGALEA
jgi:valyl-tRNA synthetase